MIPSKAARGGYYAISLYGEGGKHHPPVLPGRLTEAIAAFLGPRNSVTGDCCGARLFHSPQGGDARDADKPKERE
jgi:hypothetical protein